jgi:hypothetical protein
MTSSKVNVTKLDTQYSTVNLVNTQLTNLIQFVPYTVTIIDSIHIFIFIAAIIYL